MDEFDILLKRISEHRERFNVTQRAVDLDELIGLEEQAFDLLGKDDPRQLSLSGQISSDLELRCAIALSEGDDEGLALATQKQARLQFIPGECP